MSSSSMTCIFVAWLFCGDEVVSVVVVFCHGKLHQLSIRLLRMISEKRRSVFIIEKNEKEIKKQKISKKSVCFIGGK